MGRTTLVMLVALAAVGLVGGQDAWGVQYVLTNLDTLPGYTDSMALGINALGQVVGSAFRHLGSSQEYRPFLWDPKRGMIDLGTPPGRPYGAAYDVNDHGQVVGEVWGDGARRGVLWDPVQDIIDLGTLAGSAQGLNNLGEVVGQSSLEGAFFWSQSTGMTRPSTPGAVDRDAVDINDAGQIAGTATFYDGQAYRARGFRLDRDGSFRYLHPLPGDTSSAVYGHLSSTGQIAGASSNPGGSLVAAVWNANTDVVRVGTLPGQLESLAFAVNDSGVVVGTSGRLNSGDSVAFVWQNGEMLDLNTAFLGGRGFTLRQARAVNNLGQIAGWRSDTDGTNWSAFLLTPIPEPSSLLALLCGLGGLVVVRRR